MNQETPEIRPGRGGPAEMGDTARNTSGAANAPGDGRRFRPASLHNTEDNVEWEPDPFGSPHGTARSRREFDSPPPRGIQGKDSTRPAPQDVRVAPRCEAQTSSVQEDGASDGRGQPFTTMVGGANETVTPGGRSAIQEHGVPEMVSHANLARLVHGRRFPPPPHAPHTSGMETTNRIPRRLLLSSGNQAPHPLFPRIRNFEMAAEDFLWREIAVDHMGRRMARNLPENDDDTHVNTAGEAIRWVPPPPRACAAVEGVGTMMHNVPPPPPSRSLHRRHVPPPPPAPPPLPTTAYLVAQEVPATMNGLAFVQTGIDTRRAIRHELHPTTPMQRNFRFDLPPMATLWTPPMPPMATMWTPPMPPIATVVRSPPMESVTPPGNWVQAVNIGPASTALGGIYDSGHQRVLLHTPSNRTTVAPSRHHAMTTLPFLLIQSTQPHPMMPPPPGTYCRTPQEAVPPPPSSRPPLPPGPPPVTVQRRNHLHGVGEAPDTPELPAALTLNRDRTEGGMSRPSVLPLHVTPSLAQPGARGAPNRAQVPQTPGYSPDRPSPSTSPMGEVPADIRFTADPRSPLAPPEQSEMPAPSINTDATREHVHIHGAQGPGQEDANRHADTLADETVNTQDRSETPAPGQHQGDAGETNTPVDEEPEEEGTQEETLEETSAAFLQSIGRGGGMQRVANVPHGETWQMELARQYRVRADSNAQELTISLQSAISDIGMDRDGSYPDPKTPRWSQLVSILDKHVNDVLRQRWSESTTLFRRVLHSPKTIHAKLRLQGLTTCQYTQGEPLELTLVANGIHTGVVLAPKWEYIVAKTGVLYDSSSLRGWPYNEDRPQHNSWQNF
jgi:hypothetical protein